MRLNLDNDQCQHIRSSPPFNAPTMHAPVATIMPGPSSHTVRPRPPHDPRGVPTAAAAAA